MVFINSSDGLRPSALAAAVVGELKGRPENAHGIKIKSRIVGVLRKACDATRVSNGRASALRAEYQELFDGRKGLGPT